MYCLGYNKDKKWAVGIKDPLDEKEIFYPLKLADEAVATSGSYEQFFDYQRKRYSHIIDTDSGFPKQTDILSVSVIAYNATTADSLATAFFIIGLEGIKKFLAKNLSTLKIFVISQDEQGKHLHVF